MGGTPKEIDVQISRPAADEIRNLPKSEQQRVIKALEKLRHSRKPSGIEKLGGHPGFFRLRVGNYRVVFAKLDDNSLVVVLVVRHRKDAYKGLDKLDKKLAVALAQLAEAGLMPPASPLTPE